MNLFTVDKKFYLVLDEKNSQVIIFPTTQVLILPMKLTLRSRRLCEIKRYQAKRLKIKLRKHAVYKSEFALI